MNTLETYNKYNYSRLQLWLQYLNTTILKRSLLLALVIGSMLTILNQYDAIFSNSHFERLPLILFFVTPFVVITISQIVATHCAVTDIICGQISANNKPFITTMLTHGIPLRALVISFIIGSLNSLLIFINTFLQTGTITSAPLPLLAQVYLLPFIFGTLSQTLAYRRHIAMPASYPRSISGEQ